VMTSRALDMAATSGKRCQLCPETGVNYVVKPDTASPTEKCALTCTDVIMGPSEF
jgi:hypothetical protein